MTKLRIGPDLTLPAEAVTHTFGLLAVRGAGKTNAARILAEEMFDAGPCGITVDASGHFTFVVDVYFRDLRAQLDALEQTLPV